SGPARGMLHRDSHRDRLSLYLPEQSVCESIDLHLGTGKFSASFDINKKGRLDQIRTSEWNALCRVSQLASTTNLQFCCGDFALTTKSAGLGDVVIYDCPFPEFAIAIPSELKDDVALLKEGKPLTIGESDLDVVKQCRNQISMKGGGHYGGDEGGKLQLRILKDAAARVRKGASVVICNYATPTLL